jgi:hypothetical protein
MLDLRFQSLCLVSSFIGHEQSNEEYDKKSLFPIFKNGISFAFISWIWKGWRGHEFGYLWDDH